MPLSRAVRMRFTEPLRAEHPFASDFDADEPAIAAVPHPTRQHGWMVDVGKAQRELDLIRADVIAQLVADVEGELEGRELHAFGELDPPSLSLEVDDGAIWLVIALAGTTTACEWDGSRDDALEIAKGAAPSLAFSVSDLYWMSGGWRTRTSSE